MKVMRRYAEAPIRAAFLGLLAVADVFLAAGVLMTALFAFALGMIFLFPSAVRAVRRRTGLARRLNGRWLGEEIAPSYLPPPPPVRPQPDGWYRHERQLYRTPRWPDWHNRWQWMFGDPATWRDTVWLLLNPLAGGLLLLLPLAVAVFGLSLPWTWHPLGGVPVGLALVAAAAAGLPWLLRLYGWWNELFLGPTAKSLLASRIHELNQERVETVDSQAAELRRIERDLHDGAQARLVAIGMTLGAAETLVQSDPAAARALLAKAREASSTALTELRGLVRGIHPPVLAERGLGDAVRALALDSPLKAEVTVELPVRPEPPVESAAYFAVSELLANAARHGGADRVWIDVGSRGGAVRITVTDDGSGGADPARGSGLRGIERRLAAFDGVLALSSPPGGPTTAVIELPHARGVREQRNTEKMPWWKWLIVGTGWGLAWLPLFPQGLVTLVMKLVAPEERSWLLPLYLPDPWSWMMIVFDIALGTAMYAAAVLLPIQHSRRRWMAEAAPHRLCSDR
ncbi:signal transduction histidine kinase [Planomonospora sphaerica]|uniref:histidine kinase n=1 Tax=Planomonospora sphaerica TaxID=161355 RepID=A0A171DK34_9ACTN|nr:histidine kinase [Planomonospora sphaerica]GAT69181.1 signal transduction histidine kinase [Planomonospora sphaerica]